MKSISTSIQNCNMTNCRHCGLSIAQNRKGSDFCCNGCETVYQVLKSNNILEFYQLRAREDIAGVRVENAADKDFEYFDDNIFLE